jgi:hypothetical protein
MMEIVFPSVDSGISDKENFERAVIGERRDGLRLTRRVIVTLTTK